MLSFIIVSAGKSTRMGGINKQFLSVCGVPVIIRSIKAFDNIADVSEIIVVTNKDNIRETQDLISKYSFTKKITVTEGGNTRQESVFNGFKLVGNDCNYIAVHDGARPLISEKVIIKLIENVKKFNATTVGVPVKDTIKVVENGFIKETPDRSSLYITQTPQMFKKDLYAKGVTNAIENKLDFTDDCQLIEAIGVKVFMTDGEYSNIKITTPDDIPLAEKLVKEVL